MNIIDGKAVAQIIKAEIAQKVAQRIKQGKKKPHLAAILVGNDGASETYVKSKVKNCEKVGFNSTLLHFNETISETELLDEINKLNNNADIDGFIVQLPLPAHINEKKITQAILPNKDVDGFHPVNVGKMVLELPALLPATPYGITLLLKHYNIPTEGKNCVVIGRSHIVGTPMSILMSRNRYPGNATVTLAHSRTKNLKEICLNADILIAAVGKAKLITADMVKEGAVVIDVGIHRIKDDTKKSGYRLIGDVDFENVAPKCSYITPVPGGVGPMTITALLQNTLVACEMQEN
jgi:methylenetetrahydrofolate dehydrogenase (NADP+)/methenyltetrahydrofolate cyclohydrolase